MARLSNKFYNTFPIKDIITICAIEPHTVDILKNIGKTGKAGRPKTMIQGTIVMKTLSDLKASAAKAFFKEYVNTHA